MRETVKARSIWFKILDSQMETGTPYLLYKDAANEKSNQKNIGTIKSSNLCTEIIEYSNKDETAVCNLASIGLPKYVVETTPPFSDVTVYSKDNCGWCTMLRALLKRKGIAFDEIKLTTQTEIVDCKTGAKWNVTTVPQLVDNGTLVGGYTDVLDILRSTFDYGKLHEVTKLLTRNLDKIIDVNFYPTKKTEVIYTIVLSVSGCKALQMCTQRWMYHIIATKQKQSISIFSRLFTMGRWRVRMNCPRNVRTT